MMQAALATAFAGFLLSILPLLVHADNEIRVAVYGGGPVGLFNATKLLDMGAKVTVFERRGDYTRRQLFAVRNDPPYQNLNNLPEEVRRTLLEDPKQHGTVIKSPIPSSESRFYNRKIKDVDETYMMSVPFNEIEKVQLEYAKKRGLDYRLCRQKSEIDATGNIECTDSDGTVQNLSSLDYEILICADGNRSNCREKFFPGISRLTLNRYPPNDIDAYGFNATIEGENLPPAIRSHLQSTTNDATGVPWFEQHRYRSFITRQGLIYIGMALTKSEFDRLNDLKSIDDSTAADELWQLIKAHLAFYRLLITQDDFDVIEETRPFYKLSFFPIKIEYMPKDHYAKTFSAGAAKINLMALVGDADFAVHFMTNSGLNGGFHKSNALHVGLQKVFQETQNDREKINSKSWNDSIQKIHEKWDYSQTVVLQKQKEVTGGLNPYNPQKLQRPRNEIEDILVKDRKLTKCAVVLADDVSLATLYQVHLDKIGEIPIKGKYEGDALIASTPNIECYGSTSQKRLSTLVNCNYHIDLIESLADEKLEWLHGNCVINFLYGLKKRSYFNSNRALGLIKKLSKEKVQQIRGAACERLWDFLPQLHEAGKIVDINSNCLMESLQSITETTVKNLRYLPLAFIQSKGKEMVSAMQLDSHDSAKNMAYFSSEQLNVLLSIKDIGSYIHPSVVNVLDKDQVKKISEIKFRDNPILTQTGHDHPVRHFSKHLNASFPSEQGIDHSASFQAGSHDGFQCCEKSSQIGLYALSHNPLQPFGGSAEENLDAWIEEVWQIKNLFKFSDDLILLLAKRALTGMAKCCIWTAPSPVRSIAELQALLHNKANQQQKLSDNLKNLMQNLIEALADLDILDKDRAKNAGRLTFRENSIKAKARDDQTSNEKTAYYQSKSNQLRLFSGTSGEDLSAWINELRDLQKTARFTEDVLLQLALRSLAGVAQYYVSNAVRPVSSIGELIDTLQAMFPDGKQKPSNSKVENLMGRKQGPEERLSDFIHELATLAYQHKLTQDELITMIIRNSNQVYKPTLICLHVSKPFRSVSEIIIKARELEKLTMW